MGEALESFLRIGHLDILEELDDPVPRLFPCHIVEKYGFRSLITYPVYGIERVERILKYHPDLLASDLFEFLFGYGSQILSLEDDLSRYFLVSAGKQVHYTVCDRRLAAARLSYDSENLSPVYGAVDMIDRRQITVSYLVVYGKIF